MLESCARDGKQEENRREGGGGFEIRRKVEKQGEKKGGKNLQWTRARHYRAPCPKPAFSFHANFKFREQIGTLLLRGKRSRIEAVSGRGGRGGGIAPGDGEKSPPSPPLPADPRARYDGIITSIKAFVRLRHYGQSID